MSLNVIPKLSELLEHPEQLSALRPEAIPAIRGELARLDSFLIMRLFQTGDGASSLAGQAELIDSPELAKRWSVPESWVRDGVRNRSGDPIPCVRLGRYIRFEWGSPDLEAWFELRKSGASFNLQRRTKNH